MTQRIKHREIFGSFEGTSVYRVQLTGGGLTANIITWGASVQDLRLDDHAPPLVLGFNRFEHYPAYSRYFGATPGRYANRIAGASFEIDGLRFNTDPNYLDKHTLHGGANGTSQRNWQIADLGTSHVYLTLADPDGMMGFPGNCELTCSYTLKDDGILQVVYSAKSDAPTVANLAHHSYFTLDDLGDCRSHELQIHAQNYLPVDDELIPVGPPSPVENTPFDFRQSKAIGADLKGDIFYDHNFCLAEQRRTFQDVAKVWSPNSGISMTVATTEPGLQLFTADQLETPVPGLTGRPYSNFAGFCLETQIWPDAPNQPNYPNAILRPGSELRQVSEYRFKRD